jgi:hypothetical protein
MGLFAAPATETSPAVEALLRRLGDVAIDDTTPRRALEILSELKSLADSQ